MENQLTDRKLTAGYAAVQAGFWMNFCVAIVYAVVFLKGCGYNNTEFGLIVAAGNILGTLTGTGLASVTDRSRRFSAARLIPPVLAVQAAALLLLSFGSGRGAVTAGAYLIYIAFSIAVNSLNLKLYADAEHRGSRIGYGTCRGAGSLAYVLISVLLGSLVEGTSIRILPIAGLVITALQLAAHLYFARELPPEADTLAVEETHAASRGIASFLAQNRRFSLLLAGTAILFFAHNTACNFMINVTENVGGGAETMGYLNGFMALVEIPVMLLYGRFAAEKSSARMLKISFVAFSGKAIALSLAGSIPALFAAVLLQAPSFALYTAAIVPYVSETVPYEDAAKAQSLAFSMTTVGSVLASLISGRLYDSLPVSTVLFLAAGACLIGTVISVMAARSR